MAMDMCQGAKRGICTFLFGLGAVVSQDLGVLGVPRFFGFRVNRPLLASDKVRLGRGLGFVVLGFCVKPTWTTQCTSSGLVRTPGYYYMH